MIDSEWFCDNAFLDIFLVLITLKRFIRVLTAVYKLSFAADVVDVVVCNVVIVAASSVGVVKVWHIGVVVVQLNVVFGLVVVVVVFWKSFYCYIS